MVPYLGTHPRKLHCSHQLSPSPLHLSSPAAPQPFLRFNAQHWAEQGRSWWARTAWTGAKTNPTPAYLSAMGCPPLVSILYPLEGKRGMCASPAHTLQGKRHKCLFWK